MINIGTIKSSFISKPFEETQKIVRCFGRDERKLLARIYDESITSVSSKPKEQALLQKMYTKMTAKPSESVSYIDRLCNFISNLFKNPCFFAVGSFFDAVTLAEKIKDYNEINRPRTTSVKTQPINTGISPRCRIAGYESSTLTNPEPNNPKNLFYGRVLPGLRIPTTKQPEPEAGLQFDMEI